ncbi:integrase [Solemya velum gill symbiont]|uniref:tyrosine-type recombinase/integrase n=1 Tax=Solemya velum gill symbiont TaxID=2340 RepID=UPI000996601D|nr:integrase arm-type DNA-binding domain-containing protein [Solemya velum gill symbiont]OOZ75433.1 integrase [Solemya velum gill symbiont]
MPLSATAVKQAKPREKTYKLFDERGLYLQITPKGGKRWRLKYRFDGKEKLLSLGLYPDVSLKEAQDKRDEARKQVSAGVDPSEARKAEKIALAGADSFEAVAREWHAKFSANWSEGHIEKIIRRFEKDVFPWLGKKSVGQVTAPELLSCLRRIEARGALETAHRAKQNCGQVFRYAIATGRADRDPSQDLNGALPPVKAKHHASITEPKRIGELLRAIDGYKGAYTTLCALKLAPLLFVRPGELRRAEWVHIDVANKEWRIPAEKMKMKTAPHIIPLCTQAIEIINDLRPLTGNGKYLFPSIRTRNRPMSENTVLAALRRLGYESGEMTGHGFRSMASTILNEQGWNRDAIERQLAHMERDSVRAAYNYAEHLPERRDMMQAWADYLDKLRANTD